MIRRVRARATRKQPAVTGALVLITGGARGARVWIADVDEGACLSTADRLGVRGTRLDVTSMVSGRNLVDRITTEDGHVINELTSGARLGAGIPTVARTFVPERLQNAARRLIDDRRALTALDLAARGAYIDRVNRQAEEHRAGPVEFRTES